jgi:glyceraldehyde-3-phosphate dehydrogenase (NADP+)
MIRESDAVRVSEWIDEAVSQGAKVVVGGARRGNFVPPTLLTDVRPEMRVSRDELFGPAVSVLKASSVEDAIALANDSRYGLSAGVFTESLDRAIEFARRIDSGNIHINWGPAWRADLMPYGGMKDSGFGKEGPKYAIQEMTEAKTIVIHAR